jgi:hypothetical protein
MNAYDIVTLGCTSSNTYAQILEISNKVVGQRSKIATSPLVLTVLWQIGVNTPEKFTYAISPKDNFSTLRVDMIDHILATSYNIGDLVWFYNEQTECYEIWIKGRYARGQGARITITCEDKTAIIINPKPAFMTLSTSYTINKADAPNLFDLPSANIDEESNIMQTVTGSVYMYDNTSHTIPIEGYNATRVHYITINMIMRANGEKRTAEVILYEGGIKVISSDDITAVDNKNGTVTIKGLLTGSYLLYEIRR